MVAEDIPIVLEPLLNVIKGAVGLVQIALGGIFGLYLLLVILRWWESRRLVMLLKDIRFQLNGISDKIGVKPRHRRKVQRHFWLFHSKVKEKLAENRRNRNTKMKNSRIRKPKNKR